MMEERGRNAFSIRFIVERTISMLLITEEIRMEPGYDNKIGFQSILDSLFLPVLKAATGFFQSLTLPTLSNTVYEYPRQL
jgi:hypothetical protein